MKRPAPRSSLLSWSLLALAAVAGCGDGEKPAPRSLAYIQNTNLTEGPLYQTALAPGYTVALVNQADVATTDFGAYDLVIVGKDATLTEAQALALGALAKPYLGIGRGGLFFLGELGMDFNGGNSASAGSASVTVGNGADAIWTTPNDLDVASAASLPIYTAACSINVVHSSLVDDAVGNLGYGSAGYYSIAVDQTRYGYWGYNGAPDGWTDAGRAVFVNVLEYLITHLDG